MKTRRFFTRMYRNAEPGDEGSGLDTTVIESPQPGLEVPVPAEPAVAAPSPEDKSKSMMEAMFPAKTPEEQEAAAQRARDDKGRFANKPPVDPNALAVDPNKKPETKDLTAMPEGLTPKAQERFQVLANTNKELSARVAEWEPVVQSAQALQQTFQENGVTREQFEQATSLIGLVNRGDMAGYQRALEEQLRLVSLSTGRPIGMVDTLANFPDLRERVDALQISEADAIELARTRTQQQSQQRAQQQQQETQRHQQESQQAIHQGQLAVDRFCKSQMSSDVDYAKIEPLLLAQIQDGLLEGIPPQRWAGIVQKNYMLIKQTAGVTRSQSQTTNVLRPNGGESPRQAPKTAFEAMWGKAAPTA